MRQNRSRRTRAAGALGTLSCVIAVVVSAFFTRGLEAQSTTAQECCITLLIPFGARAVSLGQALTARTSIDGVFFNPASLANSGDEFVIHFAHTFVGQNFAFSLVKDFGVAGTFGVTGVIVDLGDIERFDDSGNFLGVEPASEQHLHVTYAPNITRGLRGGITATLYHSYAGASAATLMFDAGLQYRVPNVPGLELGASIMNAGLALQVINAEQRDPTPMRFRMGMAYELGHLVTKDKSVQAWVSTDMVARPRSFGPGTASTDTVRIESSRAPAFNIGAELAFDQTIFVRGGYAMSGDNLAKGGGGFGIGIRYTRYTIALGKSFGTTQEEGEPFQISFGITF